MKILKKAQIAGAVMLAVAGVAVGTAEADSLLAPIVVQSSAGGIDNGEGWSTYFAFKMKGSNSFGNGGDAIHYTYIKKGTSLADLEDLDKVCTMENNMGKGSKGDMIYQRADGTKMYYTGQIPIDGSAPNGYSAGPFAGMMVIDDVSQLGKQDGDMSGFAYLVHPAEPTVLSYKLLNNHHSKESGDFSIGFISKTAVDFMWLGSSPTAPALAPVTAWTLAVTGRDMTRHEGSYNSTYGLTVRVSQKRRGENDSPEDAVKGAYNNDEVVISGDRELKVTCMGSFSHSAFLTPLQNAGSQWGGWTRKSIIAQPDAYAGPDTPKVASGAIVYRADSNDVMGYSTYTTMQVETGGHLAAGHNHVNRPY